jgi:hypothetical protein
MGMSDANSSRKQKTQQGIVIKKGCELVAAFHL